MKTSSGDQHIVLAKVDVDKFSELSSKYNVKAVPTGKTGIYVKKKTKFQGIWEEFA